MKYNILIVDDNEGFRDLFGAYLETKEYCKKVLKVSDGINAIRICETNKIDIAFVDLIMPNMDGLTLIPLLKEQSSKIKIIAMSFFQNDEMIKCVNKMDLEYYLLKPFEFCNIDVLVDNYIKIDKEEDSIFIEKDIEKFLFKIGIPHHLKGFDYIKEAYRIALENEKMLDNVTNGLYLEIGERFKTSKINVERNIRHAIEMAWNNPENVQNIEDSFGGYCTQKNGRPTNKAFLKMVFHQFN